MNEDGLVALQRIPGFPNETLKELFAAHAAKEEGKPAQRKQLEDKIQELEKAGTRAAQVRLKTEKQRLAQLQAVVEISPEQMKTIQEALQSQPEIRLFSS